MGDKQQHFIDHVFMSFCLRVSELTHESKEYEVWKIWKHAGIGVVSE